MSGLRDLHVDFFLLLSFLLLFSFLLFSREEAFGHRRLHRVVQVAFPSFPAAVGRRPLPSPFLADKGPRATVRL